MKKYTSINIILIGWNFRYNYFIQYKILMFYLTGLRDIIYIYFLYFFKFIKPNQRLPSYNMTLNNEYTIKVLTKNAFIKKHIFNTY